MTQIAPITWRIAKELKLKGLSYAQVAQQTGIKPVTLRQRAKRDGWAVEKAEQEQGITPQKSQAVNDLATEIADVTTKQARVIIEALRDMGRPGNMREAKDMASALSTAYVTSRKSMGLDEDKGAGRFNLTTTFNQIVVHSAQEAQQLAAPGAVIDVSPAPSDPQSEGTPQTDVEQQADTPEQPEQGTNQGTNEPTGS